MKNKYKILEGCLYILFALIMSYGCIFRDVNVLLKIVLVCMYLLAIVILFTFLYYGIMKIKEGL